MLERNAQAPRCPLRPGFKVSSLVVFPGHAESGIDDRAGGEERRRSKESFYELR